MKSCQWVGFLLLLMSLSGCGPAKFFESLFRPDNEVVDDRLVGTWHLFDPDAPAKEWIVQFEKKETNRYLFRWTEDDSALTFEGTLGKLGGIYYMDLLPLQDSVQGKTIQIKLARDNQRCVLAPQIHSLGDWSYLVLGAEEERDSLAGVDKGQPAKVVVAHLALKLELEGEKLHLFFLEDDNLEKGIQEKGRILEHVTEPEFLITAPTAELEKFLASLPADSDYFSELGEFRKK
jgi:hypothetical protein